MRILIGILLFTWSCSAWAPEASNERAPFGLAVLTYNIHHAAGQDGVIDLQRIADVIMEEDPDLVALQEVDRFVERTGRVDQAEKLAELTGLHMAFGFAIPYQGGDFGNVILSRVPVDSLVLHPLPGEPGEDRVLMEAHLTFQHEQVEVSVAFLATHLDTFTEPRTASVPIILNAIPDSSHIFYVLAGDLNDTPGSPVIDALAGRLQSAAPPTLYTYPSDFPDRQIDHILFAPTTGWSVSEVFAMDEPVASDHAPLMARFLYNP